MPIELPKTEVAKIQMHGEKTFPFECCGLLIGKISNDEIRSVLKTQSVENINKKNPERRYNINPLDFIKIEAEADTHGLQIIGIYHSHPNHPARPSKFDLELAWPNFSYIVISIQNRHADQMTSWRLDESRTKFVEEEIRFESEIIA